MQLSLVLAQAVEPGHYISIWKSASIVLVLLLWAKLLTWMDKDAVDAHLPRVPLNIGNLSGLVLGYLLFFFLPNFVVALSVLLLVFVSEIAVYLIMRHQKVGLGDLSKQFNDWIRGLISREPKAVEAAAGEVLLIGRNGNPIAPPDSESPDLPAFEAIQRMLTTPLRHQADDVQMQPGEGAATVRYWVDGVSYTGTSVDRTSAAAAVGYLKGISGMDVNERRKPQQGTVKVLVDNKRYELQLQIAGTTAGESLLLSRDVKQRHNHKLQDLGFADDQLKLMQDLISNTADGGIVLLTAPKSQGLRSLLYGVLRGHDAFLTHLHTIERAPADDLEGVTQNVFPASITPAEEAKQTEWVVSQEPDVLMMSEVQDPRSAAALLRFAASGRRVYIGMRATSTFDALAQWRKLVGEDKNAMKHLRLIVNGRLVRRLCMACKVGYAPDPETLRRLNIAPDRVDKLFQARTQPLRDQKGNPIVCEFCNDLRFKGRVGIYEIFEINDEVGQVVLAGGSINQLKQLFRKQRRRYMQEMALARVEAGDTSVQEVLRVLRVGEPSSGRAA
jgi:general secretion pathway protein E